MNLLLIKNKEKIIFFLGLFFLISLILIFWPKFSNLLINSDSYVYLLQAKFMSVNHTLSGHLGENGDYLSPIFYRGGFSLLIYILHPLFNQDYLLTARSIILVSHLLCILLSYIFISKLFRSYFVGIFSSLILLFTYSFSNWSTVIMPEIPTIALISLSITLLIFSRKNSIFFLLSPLFLGLSILFRGEMVFLLFPIIFILVYQKRNLKEFIYYFFITLLIWLLYIIWLYQGSFSPNNWLEFQVLIFRQTINYHLYFIILLLFITIGAILYLYRPWLILLMTLPLVFVLQKLNIKYDDIMPPLYSFLYHDIVLVVFGLIGLMLLIIKNRYLGGFFLFALLILFPLYLTRGEYRYYVHLIYFLLIPFGFFIAYCWLHSKPLVLKILTTIFILLILSGQFLLFRQKNFLPDTSYEQLVANQTNQVIKLFNLNPSSTVICSVFSEAMYYTTSFSSIDCFDGLKDINRQNNFGKLIVIDEDISRHQPEFVTELSRLYPQQPIYSQWIVVPYLEKNTISFPKQQIRWYYISPIPAA